MTWIVVAVASYVVLFLIFIGVFSVLDNDGEISGAAVFCAVIWPIAILIAFGMRLGEWWRRNGKLL